MAVANLTWNAPVGSTVNGYRVEYKKAADGVWTMFSSNLNATSCQITGLDAATVYDFRITAKCPTGESAPIILTAKTTCTTTNVSDIWMVQNATANNTQGDNTVAVNVRNSAYGQYGTRIFQLNGFDDAGAPTATTWDNTTAGFFMNNVVGGTTQGEMNNCGVWGANSCVNPVLQSLANQFIGFVRVFNVPSDGIYYIGAGADNRIRILVDGKPFVENVNNSANNFRWWNIYPVSLKAGTHTIGIYGFDDGMVAACFGGEIYNNTDAQIYAATSIADLNLIYSTRWEFCQVFDAGQTIGWTCPDGWVLDTSENPPKCIKRNVDCNGIN